MTSNPSPGGPLSSSPVSVRGISPVRRRSISPDEIASRTARHSPTLGRSFDHHDPQARERQRTMDVDMALQLSLARREPFHPSPVTTFSPSGVLTSSPFDSALNHAPDVPFSMRPENDIIEEHDDDLNHTDHRFENQNAGDELPRRPSLVDIHQHSVDSSVLPGDTAHEEPPNSNFGLPSYQANASQSNFSFTIMEEFAAAEKAKLGLGSSLSPKFVLGSTRGRPKPQSEPSTQIDPSSATSPAAEGAQSDGQPEAVSVEQNSSRAMRHRKLSQSNTSPRIHRKGIGGKMALFENGAADASSSFSTRLATALGGQGASDPSYENIAVAPSTGGILNTGHDRPYRFSFYSNSFSATIHARSLSELPADGQTFEQLFSGVQPPTQDSNNKINTPLPVPNVVPAKDRPSSSMAPTPPYQDLRKHNTNINLINNHNPGANRHSAGGPSEKSGLPNSMNEDVNTWWLDVLSPTDEEMKMLSKVHISCRSMCTVL